MIDLNVDLEQWEEMSKNVKKSLGPGNGKLVLHCPDERLEARSCNRQKPIPVTVVRSCNSRAMFLPPAPCAPSHIDLQSMQKALNSTLHKP